MREKLPSRETPFGIHRVVIMALYFMAIAVTGISVQAADPLQEMLKRNGAYSHIDNEGERSSIIASVVGFGLTVSVLSGLVVGPVVASCGPKITALLGMALHSCGYLCMFMTYSPFLHHVAGICFGTAYQFILNSHLSISCLFTKNSNLVATIMCSGTNFSMFVPYLLFSVVERRGANPESIKATVMQYLMVVVALAALIDLFLLPFKPYNNIPLAEDLEQEPLVKDEVVDSANMEMDSSPNVPLYWTLSLRKQLQTPDYWIFVVFLLLGYCRRKHFTVFIRPLFQELDPDPCKASASKYATIFNRLVPAGFLFSIMSGGLIDRYGVVPMLFLHNSAALLFCITSAIPNMPIQTLTISAFVFHQLHTIAFFTSIYGLSNIATLQGLASFLIGLVYLAMDIWYPNFIIYSLESYRAASLIWAAISVTMFICPLLLATRRKVPSQSDRLF